MSLCVPALPANQAAALSNAPKGGELSYHGEVNWGENSCGATLLCFSVVGCFTSASFPPICCTAASYSNQPLGALIALIGRRAGSLAKLLKLLVLSQTMDF